MTPLEVFWDSLDQPIRIGNQVLAFSWATILLEFLLPLAVLFFVSMFAYRWAKTFISRLNFSDERKRKLTSGLLIGLRLLFVVVLMVLIGRFLEDRLIRFAEDIIKAIRTPFYKSGNTEISVLTLIMAIPVLYFAVIAGKASKLAFERTKVFQHNLAESRRLSIANLIRYSILVISLIVGLSIIGIDLSAIAIILVVLGVGIGIGLQQVVASFFAGLVIVLNRPFKEGDYIQVNVNGTSHEGMVKEIHMLNSVIVTVRNETIIMPNSHLLNNAVHNLSHQDASFHFHLQVTIDFKEDANEVQKTLLEIARRCPQWSKNTEPLVIISDFASDGIELELAVPLASAADKSQVRSWLNQEIYREFRAHKYQFAGSSTKRI